jgi:GH25 family lysozyme M1 (1,4-beta-N-acetylmuramidase)
MRKTFTLFAAMIGLVACTEAAATILPTWRPPPLRLPRPLPSSHAFSVAVRNPRFEDRRPVEWPSRQPWRYEVHGTDVSRYQSEIDWERRPAQRHLLRLHQGDRGRRHARSDVREPLARRQRSPAFPRSAYHFFYFCRPAIEQAQWFIRNVPRDRTAMPRCSTWNGTICRPPAGCARPPTRCSARCGLPRRARAPLRQEADHLHDDRLLPRQPPARVQGL